MEEGSIEKVVLDDLELEPKFEEFDLLTLESREPKLGLRLKVENNYLPNSSEHLMIFASASPGVWRHSYISQQFVRSFSMP
jgi:hypothetical protein